jgi:putative ABC transport system permease protein
LRTQLASLGQELGLDAISHQPVRFVAQPLRDFVVGDFGTTILILFGATTILLAIACINVANLLLARGAARTREIAIRQAIGARSSHVLGHLLSESFLLSAAGGTIGLLLGLAGIKFLLSIAPTDLPRLSSVPINASVLLFALACILVTGFVVGLPPALRLARTDLRTLVNEGGRGKSTGPGQNRIFGALVVAEIGLAVVLVIGAGLLVRSYVNLMGTDPGVKTDRTLTFFLNVPYPAFEVTKDAQGKPQARGTYQPIADFYRGLLDRMRGVSGVEAVAATSSAPLNSVQWDSASPFSIVGQPTPNPTVAQPQAMQRSVSPNFPSVMGMRVLSGRSLQPDDRRGAPSVVVVNETFARRFFAGLNPVGQRLTLLDDIRRTNKPGFQYGELTVDQAEIVGVVSDVRYKTLAEAAEPSIYLSIDQFTLRRMTFVVRTAGDPVNMIAPIRRELAMVDKSLPAEFALYSQIVRGSLARQRLGMTLLVCFSAVALLLAAVGIYGLMSYSVTQRTGEIAVRAALGASAGQVRGLILWRGTQLGLGGIFLGLVGAFALRRIVASQLYGVSALDLGVFVLVPVILLGVALVACYLPARRASLIDPAVMLRTD